MSAAEAVTCDLHQFLSLRVDFSSRGSPLYTCILLPCPKQRASAHVQRVPSLLRAFTTDGRFFVFLYRKDICRLALHSYQMFPLFLSVGDVDAARTEYTCCRCHACRLKFHSITATLSASSLALLTRSAMPSMTTQLDAAVTGSRTCPCFLYNGVRVLCVTCGKTERFLLSGLSVFWHVPAGCLRS